MKWWWALFAVVVLVAAASVYWLFGLQSTRVVSPVVEKILEKPLDKYTIEKLSQREYDSEIFLGEAVATTSAYTVYKFHFNSDGKRVTGLAHLPAGRQVFPNQKFPVVVQFRGYVDVETYQPGMGTRRTAEVLARSGFISLAPDFLGYGGSDNPSEDVFEARFETYTAALNLIAAADNGVTLPAGRRVSTDNLGLWGHSNGGQIALTVLEISGGNYPTTLWAPVSKPFPYSILYYTDEADDKGKALRKKLADFERDYDVFLYDTTRYLDRLSAPIQIHQGLADEAAPYRWSRELVENLRKMEKDVVYFEYPGADHNLSGSWDRVVTRDVEFFNQHLK